MDGTGGGKNEAGWWGLNVGNRGDGFIWREECWHAERFISDYSTAYIWSGPERLCKKREKRVRDRWNENESGMRFCKTRHAYKSHSHPCKWMHAKYTDQCIWDKIYIYLDERLLQQKYK